MIDPLSVALLVIFICGSLSMALLLYVLVDGLG